LKILKILSYTLTIKVRGRIFLMSRPLKVGLGTCITLPYLNCKGKIIGGGVNPSPPYILDKNSPIGKGVNNNK